MSSADADLWRAAMEQFDALVDLAPPDRLVALETLQRESPALAEHVRELLATDARAESDAVASGATSRGSDDSHERPGAAHTRSAPAWPRITGFRVLSVLGKGGMGEVFLAERESDDFVQRVALKRILLGGHGSDLHDRFLRERRILAQLNHPNIARLIDGGLDQDGNPYFAMEWVDGVSLTRYAHEQQLELRARLRLFIVVCEAVAFAQSNLVVHRDIKPSNVLVDTTGQVKLLDFGIAKLLAPSDSHATATLAMTPAYAAPEQLLGEAISTATDVYALGMLLFELLVGQLPERSWRDRMRDAVSEQNSIERPSLGVLRQSAAQSDTTTFDLRQQRRLAQQLRGDLDQIVLMALRRDPARRYATAQALADDLLRFLQGRPVRARADHWRYRVKKFVLRNAWATTAASLTFAGLITATAVSISFANSERSARALAETERSKAGVQAERATRTKDFVVNLFSDIDPLDGAAGKGNEYTAVELIDTAAKRVDRDLADLPEAQAELRATLAQGLMSLGRPQAARPMLDTSISQLRALHGENAPQLLANALHSRSMARADVSELDGAEADAREALAIALTLPDGRDARGLRITIRTNIASLLQTRRNSAEALTHYQAILSDRIGLLGRDDEPALAVDWNNLSTVYQMLERFDEAESSARRAMQLFADANGREHPRMVWLHNALGQSLLGQERLDQAHTEFETARRLALAKFDANHEILLLVHLGIGRVASARLDYPVADTAFAEALRIGITLNHPNLASVEIRFGLSLLQRGRYAEAERRLRRGIERLKILTPEFSSPLALQGSVARGLALAHLGRAAEGEAIALTAMKELTTLVDQSKPRYIESKRLLDALKRQRE